jgi:hypothetical protein
MSQAVSLRFLTAEVRVQYQVGPCGGGQSDTGTDFSPSTSVLPCQFHSTGTPLLGKTGGGGGNTRINRRVAQKGKKLRCVRSICCGGLHHKKNPSGGPSECRLTS